ncbi:MAG: hypothetical protein ACOZAO_06010 [Patescibacteria group bacterium]
MTSNVDFLEVIIRNRKKVFYDGQARSVSSYNDKGIFDILPLHANFISLIKDKIFLVTPDNQTEEISIDTGVLRTTLNGIEIYLDVTGEKSTKRPGTLSKPIGNAAPVSKQ